MRLTKKLLPPCATLLHINILKPLTACMFTHLCLATTMLGGDLCGDSCLPDLLEVNGHHYMVQSLRPLFLEIDTRSGQKLEKTLLSSKVVTPTTSGDWYQVWAKVGEDITVLQNGDPDYFWKSIPGMGKSWRHYYCTVLQSGNPNVIWVWAKCSSLPVHWDWARSSSHHVQLSST